MFLENGETIDGRVRLVSPEINKSTRLGRIRIALPNHPSLRIGAFARGNIEIQRVKHIITPRTAIIFGMDGPAVLVANSPEIPPLISSEEGNQAATQISATIEQRKVKISPANGRYVQVMEGLSLNDLVVVRSGAFLSSGDTVRIMQATDDTKKTR